MKGSSNGQWRGECEVKVLTVGHCAIHLDGWRRYKLPSSSMVESWWILQYLNLDLILSNNTWMVMHFFMCIAVQSHRKMPKVQNFQFSSFLSDKKRVCFIVLAGKNFSNLKGKQFKSHRSVPRSALQCLTLKR